MCPEQFWKDIEDISFDYIIWLTKIALCLSIGAHCTTVDVGDRLARASPENNAAELSFLRMQHLRNYANKSNTARWGFIAVFKVGVFNATIF